MSEVLPEPSGQYAVGFKDVDYQERVLARIYYPADLSQEEYTNQRGTWLPSSEYYPGYGYFLRIPAMISGVLGRIAFGGVRLWAVENAPFAKRLYTPEPRADSTDGSRNHPLLIIFSHGLGGIRTTYSVICTELASHGYIVAALEHRDGTASMTLTKDQASSSSKIFTYQSTPLDVDEVSFRQSQLLFRCEEIKVLLDNFFQQEEFIVDGKCSLVMMGHSFGAATSILYSQKDVRVQSIIALDPWMIPFINFPTVDYVPLSSDTIIHRSLPFMVVTMEQFHWPENIFILNNYYRDLSGDFPANSAAISIIQASHQQCSDIPLWKSASFLLKRNSPPTIIVLRLCNKFTLLFLLESKISSEIKEEHKDAIRPLFLE